MKNGHTRCKIFLGALAIFLLSFSISYGQEFRGTISGMVTDPNGAAVPGATVTLQNTETNITASVTANDEGSYTFPLQLPGKYKVSATAASFKTSVQENIVLNVDDRLTVDMQLQIGATTEVNIVADTELIETRFGHDRNARDAAADRGTAPCRRRAVCSGDPGAGR